MTRFELEIILKLQSLGGTVFDYINYILTQFGSEIVFLAIAAVLFWCVNKRTAYRFINVYLIGAVLTGAIKILIKRPRPYNAPYDKQARSILEETTGFSFPSGHSQSIANISAQFTIMARRRYKQQCRSNQDSQNQDGLNQDMRIRDVKGQEFQKQVAKKLYAAILISGIFLTLVVMFTRIYLGQHYPTDVLTGALLGVASALFFTWLFELLKGREEVLVFAILPLTVVATTFLIGFNVEIADFTKVLGVYGAVSLGYYIEKRFVRYNVKSGKIYKQAIKVALGIAVVLAFKEGLKQIGIAAGFESRVLMMLDYCRYFLMGIFASLGAPALFKAFKL